MIKTFVTLCFTCVVSALPLWAEDPISPDRPGLADSSLVVGKNIFQLESGLEGDFAKGAHANSQSYFFPTLLRYGVSDSVELRLEGNTLSRDRSYQAGERKTDSGFAPISVGIKYQLYQPSNENQDTYGIIARVFPPSGSDDYKNKHTNGDLRAAFDTKISNLDFEANLGLGVYDDDDQDTFGTALAAATLSKELSETAAVFIDAGLQEPEYQHGSADVIIDGGATYLIDNDTQLDLSVGSGVAGDHVPDIFFGVGIARRCD